MITKEIKITNRLGLHARAAARLVAIATSYNAQITLQKEEKRVNCKSIMSVLMLAASQGSVLTLTAEGEDETSAIAAIIELIENCFNEEE